MEGMTKEERLIELLKTNLKERDARIIDLEAENLLLKWELNQLKKQYEDLDNNSVRITMGR